MCPWLCKRASDYIVSHTLIHRLLHLFIIIFWLHWLFIVARGRSLVAASRGCSSLWCAGFFLWRLLSLQCTGSLGTWAQQLQLADPRVQAHRLWYMCLVALRHVESSRSRDWTQCPLYWQALSHPLCAGKSLYLFRWGTEAWTNKAWGPWYLRDP